VAGAGGDEHDGRRRRVGGGHDRVHLLDGAGRPPARTGARRRAAEEATGGAAGVGCATGTRGGFKPELGETGGGRGGRDGMGDLPY